MVEIATVLFLIVTGGVLFMIDTRTFSKRAKFLKANGEIEDWADNAERRSTYLAFFKAHRRVQMSLAIVCILVAISLYFQNAADIGIVLLFMSVFHYSAYRKAGRWRSEAEAKIKAVNEQQAVI